MEVDRPGPGEELNEGEPTAPRTAASVMVLRGGDTGLEVLLVQRNPAQRFMGGAWVFPGGAVDPEDGDGGAGLPAGARREGGEGAGGRPPPARAPRGPACPCPPTSPWSPTRAGSPRAR